MASYKPRLEYIPGQMPSSVTVTGSTVNRGEGSGIEIHGTYQFVGPEKDTKGLEKLRSWNSERLTSRSMTVNMAAAAGLSSTRPQVQFAGNSGIFYQDSSKSTLSTRNSSELKSCSVLSAKTGNRTTQNGRSKSTPRVYPVGREISSHVYISDGLLCRDLAIRSSASNPKLHLGRRQRRRNGLRPRPKSLPTDLELETILPVLARQSNVFGRGETVIVPSKEGYHPRSKSPTYRTLMETKEVLVLELSKRLREIRRDLGGIKARENSAAFNERLISSDTGGTFSANDWYIQMLDVLQDDDAMVHIGESLNSEDVDQSESLPLEGTARAMRLQFSAECLRAHINDEQIIRMDVEEVEQRLRAKRNKELSQKKKVWDVPIGTPPELSSRSKPKSKKMTRKSSKQYDLVLPQVDKTKFKVSKSSQGNKDVATNYIPPLILVITENDQFSEEPVVTPVKQPEAVEQQQSQQTPNSPEINNNIDSEVNLEKTPLVPEIVSPVKQTYNSPEERTPSGTGSAAPVRKTDLHELSQRLLGSSIKTKIIEEVVPPVVPVPVEEKKPLTEKEKFLVMRKRMEERKAAQSKKMESFRDISMLGLSFDKQRERRGKLGNIIASKIDSMLAFGGDSDDDDDDDDDEDGDDYDSMIDTDEEPELKNLPAGTN